MIKSQSNMMVCAATVLFLAVVCGCGKWLNPKQWVGMGRGMTEGFGGKNDDDDDDDKRYFHSSASRLSSMQGDYRAWDVHNQAQTLQEKFNNGEEVSESAIFDFLKSKRAYDEYDDGYYSADIKDRISQKIARGEYVTPEELDAYRNYEFKKKYSSSSSFSRPGYYDEYSVDDYNRRMSQVMPEAFSGRRAQPSRDEMRRGVVLDREFSSGFATSSDSPDTWSSAASSAPPMPMGTSAYTLDNSPSNYSLASLERPSGSPDAMGAPTYNLPSPDDPYAMEGVSRSQIPPGQEDQYILKSKIVPPVCPACPTTCPTKKSECPPCPACEACPEPTVECKRVAKYKRPTKESKTRYPVPVLNDFSQFGI